jgi:hypothetical protein
MELSFASTPESVTEWVPEPRSARTTYPTDLFEAARVDAQRVRAPVPCNNEAPPAAANDPVNVEAQTLAAIVDLLIEMWREASGEDLRPSILGSHSL